MEMRINYRNVVIVLAVGFMVGAVAKIIGMSSGMQMLATFGSGMAVNWAGFPIIEGRR